MKNLSCQEIRETWINFFTKKCDRIHQHIASGSLVPDNPTLLLNAAGMVQFVPIFVGTKPAPEPPRAVTVQKCARVGGKDSDLENIGRTTRHHSFFEMLGNFSFGDYFKNEAIKWAWQFVREELELDADKLYVSIFEGDEQNPMDTEAQAIWLEILARDFPDLEQRQKRIWKMGRKDNFWGPPGTTGPCGPCSEIYYDLGDHISDPEDRYLEIWNLVFMEFLKDEEGKFTPLENKNIDTGAGLERIATILQGVNNSFETNELFNVMQSLAKDLGLEYGKNPDHDLYLKIITDHLRCLCFLIADGVRPSNMGRGYVLRMITRRAARFVYLIRNQTDAFLYKHCTSVIQNYSLAYPELQANSEAIVSVCRKEEEAFAKTIVNGLALLEEKLKASGKMVDGEFIFDLYSTYGLPLELSKDIVEEQGLTIDLEAYQKSKDAHSKASGTGNFKTSVESNSYVADLIKKHGPTKFLGYDQLEAKAKVLAIHGNDIVLDQTPFYAESGGQVADSGTIRHCEAKPKQSNGQVKATDVIASVAKQSRVTKVKKIEGIFIHTLESTEDFNIGDEVTAQVNSKSRNLTGYHHTTCHLLQAALRQVLGNDIQQMGSQVGPEYTRFDFNLDRAMTKEEIFKTEKIVNDWIQAKLPVETKVMDFDDAIAAGALSFFEEKYDDQVRVLFIRDDQQTASIELCGGTHVSNIGDIREVVLAQEGSVAAGIRRIRMLAHDLAAKHREEEKLKEAALAQEQAAQEKAKAEAKAQKLEQNNLVLTKTDEILSKSNKTTEAQIIIANLADYFPGEELETDAVKTLIEALLSKIESSGSQAFILVAAASTSKVTFMAAASQELVKDKNSIYNASNAVKTAAQICGGGGGGRPNFAQAGGKDPSKVPEALQLIQEDTK